VEEERLDRVISALSGDITAILWIGSNYEVAHYISEAVIEFDPRRMSNWLDNKWRLSYTSASSKSATDILVMKKCK
jgi:hypothetical protein